MVKSRQRAFVEEKQTSVCHIQGPPNNVFYKLTKLHFGALCRLRLLLTAVSISSKYNNKVVHPEKPCCGAVFMVSLQQHPGLMYCN